MVIRDIILERNISINAHLYAATRLIGSTSTEAILLQNVEAREGNFRWIFKLSV